MEMTYEQQQAYLDNVDSMSEVASKLEDEATALYNRVEQMAKELDPSMNTHAFNIKFRAYRALLTEADIAADAAKLARNMAQTAIVKFVDEVELVIVH